jgi:hypothetical protein
MKQSRPVLLALLVLVVGGCGGPDEAARVANTEPEATVTAAELLKAYDEDIVAANAKYKDKVIVVDGIVDDVLGSPEATIYLVGEPAAPEEVGVPKICCDFLDGAGKMPQVKKGDNIKIKGLCGSELSAVFLDHCVPAD